MHLPTIGIAPTSLTDPAWWPYLAEPELFFLMLTVGVRSARLQLTLYWTMAALRCRRAFALVRQ
jgi:hypothetical protein